MGTVKAYFPSKLDFLFWPGRRYKVAYGGRGGVKSWSFARALLIRGLEDPLRILCAREVQKTIKDSVHQLLSDQIRLLELDNFYTVGESTITGRNGTNFAFTGLQQHTVHTLKSFEGADICWVEEAQAVSRRSWSILIPTIRKENSEIWVSFNPDLETDETYQRFVVNPPPDCIAVHTSYRDNPWWNDTMEADRLHCQATDPDNYPNIYEGQCRPAVEGAIFFKEIMAAEAEGRICDVPYDPMLKVHPVFDLGYNDFMFIILVQRHLSALRVIRSIQDNRRTLDSYSAELKELHYNWGKVWLPHDGYSKDFKTGKSTEEIMQALGWTVAKRTEIVEASVEEGIRVARMTFPQVYIDKTHNAPLIESLKRYRRRMNQQTDSESTPVKDDYCHGADAFRYMALNKDNMHNETDRPRIIRAPSYAPLDPITGY